MSWSTSPSCSGRAPRRAPRRSRRPVSSAGGYVLATAHRAGNVDDPVRLEALVALLRAVPGPGRAPPAPAHRRAARRRRAARGARARVRLTPPLGYLDFTALLRNARAVLTDSGGVQKEAYLAGVPA